MNEKIYKTMGRVGGGNIAMGAVLVVVGVATGVLMIVSGAGLLNRRGDIMFLKSLAKRKYAGIFRKRVRRCGMPAFLIAVGRTTQKGETKMKQETKARIRVVGRILFLVYLLALVYFLFFAEEYGRRNFFELDYRYNLVPFQEIRRFWIYREKVGFLAAFLNLAGNVIGFLPFGFIVPVMHKKMESFWKVSLLGFMFSLCVETIQLITKVGCFDVDDLMLNTLGAMIGCGAFLICNKFRRWKYGEEEV